jgi:anti-anti-sigma factor
MNVQISSFEDYKIISVDGRIDTMNAGEFEAKIVRVIELGATKIILDCSGLNYISSSGLRIFLLVLKKMKANNGQFSLCSLQPGIREIFDIAGFSSIFSIYADQETALKG